MSNTNNPILLNDILQLEDISNVKIRFNLMFGGNWNPIDIFKSKDSESLLNGHYHNYKKKSYKEGQITINNPKKKQRGVAQRKNFCIFDPKPRLVSTMARPRFFFRFSKKKRAASTHGR